MNKVLIIEDDTIVRRQLVQLFRLEEFEVAEADSGQPGIAAATEQPPDLVVCDIMMPGTDGYGVLRALRNQPRTSLIPFIFLTAKAAGADVRVGMNQGADDYITKPFDPEALIASARQRLERRRTQLNKARRHGERTGKLAAAAIPREMESCLSQLDAIAETLAREPGSAMREHLARLRVLSRRLRLYGELPGLYARRFNDMEGEPASSTHDAAVEAAKSAAKHWGRDGDLRVAARPGSVPLSEESLGIVVRELVDNACKFSPASSPIGFDINTGPACWNLTVSDRGRGFPEPVEEVGAFKQFWNGAARPDGLGLGLVLVRGLVRLHSGETLITSDPRAGTSVAVMIPVE